MRFVVSVLIAIVVAGCHPGKDQPLVKLIEPVSPLYIADQKPFYHGVASGDPLSDRVILWTRVTPEDSVPSVEVMWEISENEKFDPVLKEEVVKTGPERDYTVKVDAGGLEPGRPYFYAFEAIGERSPIGNPALLLARAVAQRSSERRKRLPGGTMDVFTHGG